MILTLMHWPPRRRSNRTGSRTAPKPYVSDEQWLLIADLFPDPPMTSKGGRPRVAPRACLEGVLWVLHTGARWKDFTRAVSLSCNLLAPASGLDRVGRVSESLAPVAPQTRRAQTDPLGRSDWRCHVFPSKKGGAGIGRTKRGKGTKIFLMVDAAGTPLSAFSTAANVAEVNAVETLVDESVTGQLPDHLLYDKAADADWLRDGLATREVELVCPHRRGRQRPATQDGRALRRYWRRFVVERSISWLQNCRRLVVRYEYHDHLFDGFVQLACMYTIIKWL